MKIRYIILLLLLSLLLNQVAFSQAETQTKEKKWEFIIKTSVGYIASLNSVPKIGYITDYFTFLESNDWYIRFPPTGAIFYKNWGIEIYASKKFSTPKQNNYPLTDFATKYSDDYFINISNNISYPEPPLKFNFGPVYKYEDNDFIVTVGLLLGSMDFAAKQPHITLKGKETNEIINIDWQTDQNFSDITCFNLHPAITFGYKINNWFAFGLDINYWLNFIDFEYTEKIENAVTQDIQTQTYQYKKLFNEISFSLGIMFSF